MISVDGIRLRSWCTRRYAKILALVQAHPSVLRATRIVVLASALGVSGWFAAVTMREWIVIARYPLNLDFSLYRASALQGIQFGWSHLYDLAAQRAIYDEQQAIYPDLGPMVWAPNVYTPPVSWIALPFTYLTPPVGYLIWSLIILASTTFAYTAFASGSLAVRIIQILAAFCPYLVLLSLTEGQVDALQLAAVAGSWLLLKRGHDGWAGLPLVALVLKPQTLALVPLALLIAGRYRTFVTWVVAMVLLGIAMLANVGLHGALAYLSRVEYAASHPGEYLLGPWYNLSLHFGTRVGRLGAEILAGAWALWIAWRWRRTGPEIPMASGLVGSLLISSYLHLNDLIMLLPAGWLIWRAVPKWWVAIGLAGGYTIMLLCTPLGTPHWGEGLLLFEVSLLGLPTILSSRNRQIAQAIQAQVTAKVPEPALA